MPPGIQIRSSAQATQRVATVLLAPAVFGRPMAATRDVPPDRVKTLRVGYHSSLKDPALLEELKKRRWVDSISGGSWRS